MQVSKADNCFFSDYVAGVFRNVNIEYRCDSQVTIEISWDDDSFELRTFTDILMSEINTPGHEDLLDTLEKLKKLN